MLGGQENRLLFALPSSSKKCARCSRNSDTLPDMWLGVGEGEQLLCQELKFAKINHNLSSKSSPESCKPLTDSRAPKLYTREILPVQLLVKRSVQFSRSVVSHSLWPHESQHARPPCPSPTPGVYSDSCPSSRWCHPAISSSVIPFSSCPQSLPVSGTFPMSQLFAWRGQSFGASDSASVLPMNTQDWSPLGWTGWISLQFMGLSRVFSNTTVQKHQFFGSQPSLWSNYQIHTRLLEKP